MTILDTYKPANPKTIGLIAQRRVGDRKDEFFAFTEKVEWDGKEMFRFADAQECAFMFYPRPIYYSVFRTALIVPLNENNWTVTEVESMPFWASANQAEAYKKFISQTPLGDVCVLSETKK